MRASSPPHHRERSRDDTATTPQPIAASLASTQPRIDNTPQKLSKARTEESRRTASIDGRQTAATSSVVLALRSATPRQWSDKHAQHNTTA
jgi:hypothetical protein